MLFEKNTSSFPIWFLQIALAVILVIDRLILLPDYDLLYQVGGSISPEKTQAVVSIFNFFMFLPINELSIWAFNVLVIIFSFLFALGFGGRWVVFILAGLVHSLVLRHLHLIYISDTIPSHLLLLFLFVKPIKYQERFSAIAAKNIYVFQLFLFCIYFANGIGKLRGQAWLNGDALYYVKNVPMVWNDQFHWAIFENHYFLKILSYSVLIFELTIPFFLMLGNRRIKFFAFVIAVFFHLCIFTMMNLGHSQLVLIMILTVFLPWDQINLSRLPQRIRT